MVDATTLNPLPPTISTRPTYFWRRRRFWIWSLVLFIVAVVGFVASLPTTRALVQFYRVKAGMSEQEVVELLGSSTNRMDYEQARPQWKGWTTRHWYVGELSLHVEFRGGKATVKRMRTDLPIARQLFPNLFDRDLL